MMPIPLNHPVCNLRRAIVIAAWLLLSLKIAWSAPIETSATNQPLTYMIVVTGGELLEGVYPDAHTPFLTRALRPLGAQCVGSMTVDDDRNDIQSALRFATNRAPLVIVTGGLGPTPNDITRDTLSEFTAIPLREQPELVHELEKRFHQTRAELRPNVLRQTRVPEKGGFLNNTQGTAAGIYFETGTSLIVSLPGPPRELQPMVRNELIPLLQKRFGVRQFGSSLTLRFVGAGQSLIDQTIKDHVALAPDVVVTSLFEGSRVDFTFSLPGSDAAERDRLKRLEKAIREHLEPYIYADDGASLEEVLLARVRAQGGKLVVVEIVSGGAIAAALNGASGHEAVLNGGYTAPGYASLAKLLNATPITAINDSSATLETLGAAALATTGSQWAIAVGDSERDPSGVARVSVAFHLPQGRWERRRLEVRGDGEIARTSLTTLVLDAFRKVLLAP